MRESIDDRHKYVDEERCKRSTLSDHGSSRKSVVMCRIDARS